jgi:hypothetical protein
VAAYHGGKLNAVDCQCFMHYASAFFSENQEILLNSQNHERCTDSVIEHRGILIVLDTICSRLCKKTGQAAEDFNVL